MSRTFAIDCNNCGKIHGVGQQPVLILGSSVPIKVAGDRIVVVWDLDGYKCPVCRTIHLDSRSSEIVWKATEQEGDIPQWIIRRKFGLSLKYGSMAIPFNEEYKDDDIYKINPELRPFVDGSVFRVYTIEVPVKSESNLGFFPGNSLKGRVNFDNILNSDEEFKKFASNLEATNPTALREAMIELNQSSQELLGDVNTSKIPKTFSHHLNSLEPSTKEISNLASQMDKLLNIAPDAHILILAPKTIEGNV